MEQPNYYAVIPANVRYDKTLTDKAKLLYGEITSLSNKDGYCWASNGYFADLYDVTPQAVSKWIKNLEDGGYIHTRLIYKKGSKEVEKRIIIIAEQKQNEVSTGGLEVSTDSLGGINPRFRGVSTGG